MKLVLAVINNDDAAFVISNLSNAGFSCTKLASTGGFLSIGNTTIIVGVGKDRVQEVIDIISEYSHSRKELLSVTAGVGISYIPSEPIEVIVG